MVSPNKAVSGEQCFIMDLGLFWKIVTGLATKTPNGIDFLEPGGYCIFLPGVHFLTLNDGADALLNKHNHTVNI